MVIHVAQKSCKGQIYFQLIPLILEGLQNLLFAHVDKKFFVI